MTVEEAQQIIKNKWNDENISPQLYNMALLIVCGSIAKGYKLCKLDETIAAMNKNLNTDNLFNDYNYELVVETKRYLDLIKEGCK